MVLRWIALCLLVVVAMPSPVFSGGLKSSTEQVRPEQTFNPNPAPDDIILPMPCDLHMVFKAVEIPSQGLLWDRPLSMGCEKCDRPAGMEYYEQRYQSAIAGPFTRADLPEQWRGLLATSQGVTYNYYFIGKYEVTALQWKAVMEGTCPAGPITEADTLPKTNISWFDAIDFSRRYTEWLLKNAPASLPHFQNDTKNVGYLRMPTEAEWEYAARGGNRVPDETMKQEDFFPMDHGTSLGDYAVYRAEGAARIFDQPLGVGSRKPNPLGLYDIAGNVAEMVLDTFHFTVGSRLHGSAGGFLRKGGSFSSSEGEIMPGRREEIAYFSDQGATATKDMGVRLVLSGINTPDGGRRQELMSEWDHLGKQGSIVITGENPLQELDKLLAATKDPDLNKNLSRLRSIIKDNQVQLEKKDSENVEGLIRTTVYVLEALRSYAVRNSMVIGKKDESLHLMEELKAKGQQNSDRYKEESNTVAQYEAARVSFIDGVVAILNFYKIKLGEILKYKEETYMGNLNIVKAEYKKTDMTFMKNMSKNIDILEKHLALMRKNKQDLLTRSKILDDVLVKALRDDIKIQ